MSLRLNVDDAEYTSKLMRPDKTSDDRQAISTRRPLHITRFFALGICSHSLTPPISLYRQHNTQENAFHFIAKHNHSFVPQEMKIF